MESNDLLVTGSIVYVDENSTSYSDATLWTNGVPATLPKGSDGINVYFASSIELK